MRFSLKWALAATAYVALGAAAFGRPRDAFTLALWAVSALAMGYAMLTAIGARGRRQLVARGFVVGAAIALSCLYAFPLPGPRVEHFFGDGDGDPMIASYLQSVFELDQAIQLRRSASRNPGDAALRSLTAERARTESMMNQYRLASPSFALASKRYQCFNAVGAMVGGLIGAVLGSLAFRRTGDCDLAVARLST